MTDQSQSTTDYLVRSGARRTRTQWRGMKPEAVIAGSEAQILYCIQDARHDILCLYAEIDQLRSGLESRK